MGFGNLFRKLSVSISDFYCHIKGAPRKQRAHSYIAAHHLLDDANAIFEELSSKRSEFDEDDSNRYRYVSSELHKARDYRDQKKIKNFERCFEDSIRDCKLRIWERNSALYHNNGSITSPGITEAEVLSNREYYFKKLKALDTRGIYSRFATAVDYLTSRASKQVA